MNTVEPGRTLAKEPKNPGTVEPPPKQFNNISDMKIMKSWPSGST